MKKIIALLVLSLFFASCEKPGDCVKSAGATTSRIFDGFEFHTIVVNKGISVVIAQGDAYKVEVQTGENLINDIGVNVTNGVLTLEDYTTCNWVREYGQTVVYITAPHLTDIYSKTERNILSKGVLTYPELHIVSMDSYDTYNGTGTGDFYLQVNNNSLFIENNSVSRFYLSGQTTYVNFSVYESGGIIYGQELRAQHVYLYHRGSNDMYVHPIQSVSGDLYNIGNVYSVARPPEENINVVEHYNGKLFFL